MNAHHHIDPGRIARGFRNGAAAIGLLLAAALAVPAGGGETATAVTPAPVAPAADVAPVASLIDDLIRMLEQVVRDLDDAVAQVGTSLGPLNGTALTMVTDDLAMAEAGIDTVLDPNLAPSLDPPGAGAVDPSIAPGSLGAYANQCALLGQEGLDELRATGAPDYDYVGTRLRTIKSLLPGYRDAAGI